MALLFIRNVLLDERLILWLNCELKCSNSSLSLSGASYWSILWIQTARSCNLIHRHSLSQHPHRQRHHQGRLFSQLQHPNRLRPTSATTRLVWDFQFNLKVLILYIYFIICQSLMFVKVSLTIFSLLSLIKRCFWCCTFKTSLYKWPLLWLVCEWSNKAWICCWVQY